LFINLSNCCHKITTNINIGIVLPLWYNNQKVRKMTLYNAIIDIERDKEHCKRCSDSRRARRIYLEQTLEQFREELPSLRERAKALASDLREVEKEVRRGSTIQYHRLSEYWGQEKISNLDSLAEIFGKDIWSGNTRTYSSHDDRPLRAVKQGILWQCNGNIYSNPGIARKIRNAAIATSVAIGVGLGIAGLAGLQELIDSGANYAFQDLGLKVLPAVFGGFAILGSTIYVLENVKNPFENVAKHFEERSQYVLEKLPEISK